MFLTMATSGFRTSLRDGFRIATVTGYGNRPMAGPGLVMSPGDGLRITMAAGSGTAVRGHGGQDLSGSVTTPSGRRHTCRSGVGVEASGSALDGVDGVVLAGCRSGHAIGSTRGGVDIVAASAGSDVAGTMTVVAGAASNRCMEERGSRTFTISAMNTFSGRCRPS